jgi:hypothetical protein
LPSRKPDIKPSILNYKGDMNNWPVIKYVEERGCLFQFEKNSISFPQEKGTLSDRLKLLTMLSASTV